MTEQSPTARDCLRNVLRRTGRTIPPSAESIAAPLTNDELQKLVCDMLAILITRRCSE